MKKIVSSVVTLGCLVLLSACGTETTPLSSDAVSSPVTSLSVASAEIGSAGGMVVNGLTRLSVPQGSLSSATHITMESVVVDGKEVAEFGPSGLQFANGALLRLPVPAGTSLTDEFSVEWFDPASSEWVDIGGTRVGDDVEVVLYHFSRYRVTSFGS